MREAAATRRALLIVGHGSRNDQANGELVRFAAEIASARDGWLVSHAFMELAEPGFEQAIEALVEAGASEILVHLHFLAAGYHVREDVPKRVTSVRQRHPGLHIETTDPIGHDSRLAEIVLERMDDQVGRPRAPRQRSKL